MAAIVKSITNAAGFDMYVRPLERPDTNILLRRSSTILVENLPFPWVDNDYELQTKSICIDQIHENGKPTDLIFSIFIYYSKKGIFSTRFGNGIDDAHLADGDSGDTEEKNLIIEQEGIRVINVYFK